MRKFKFLVMCILVVFISYGCFASHPITISGKTTGIIKVTDTNDRHEDKVRISSYEYEVPATTFGGMHLDGKIPINTAHYYISLNYSIYKSYITYILISMQYIRLK